MATLTAPRRSPERLRLHGTPVIALAGVGGLLLSLWLTVVPLRSLTQTNDFISEAWPVFQTLSHGRLLHALQVAPAYYGSLILRAPFGLLGAAVSPHWQLSYILSAAPCLAAAPLLGAWLTSERGPSAGASLRWRWCGPLGLLLAVNPVFLYCVALGHPEQILSAVLAVVAVITAARGRWLVAMVLIAIAAFNQPWALAAVPVAVVVLPDRRGRALITVALTLGILFVPTTLLRTGGSGAVGSLGGGVGQIFYPQQLWWWFGPHAWVSIHAHELIVLAGGVCAAAWWSLHRADRLTPDGRLREGLLLLALVLLLRTVMDPWNNLYYELPFLIVLYALYARRPPVHLLVVTALMFLLTVPPESGFRPDWGGPTGADLYAVAYQLLTVPMVGLLALRVFGSRHHWIRVRGRLGNLLPPSPTL
ncbi:hypothetical protein [Conexibacter sp. DBS9H8]|uniref:hypothetical protein n=1 Tax=Conexibacter sp. DBS9H8 TaxID=2937801 RepID=UPI00200F7C17|nr:hypothetical protein [Conexibacter sp. DBS9H8]